MIKLQTKCSKCENIIQFNSWHHTRVEFAKNEGEFKELSCKKCWNTDKYHISQIKAEKNKLALIIGLIIFLIGTPIVLILMFDYLAGTGYIFISFGLIALPFTIYGLIESDQRKKIRGFNSYKY